MKRVIDSDELVRYICQNSFHTDKLTLWDLQPYTNDCEEN